LRPFVPLFTGQVFIRGFFAARPCMWTTQRGQNAVLAMIWGAGTCAGIGLQFRRQAAPGMTDLAGRRAPGLSAIAERDAHHAGEFGLAIGL